MVWIVKLQEKNNKILYSDKYMLDCTHIFSILYNFCLRVYVYYILH